MKSQLLLIHALSPLHAGTGQGLGLIDLPIAREKATNIPYIPGSSLKGVLRDVTQDAELRGVVFGPDTSKAHEYAGAAQFGDAKLLLLPVRSLAGTFAYVSSPYILSRFANEAKALGLKPPQPLDVTGHQIKVTNASVLGVNDLVFLEDLDLKMTKDRLLDEWAQWLLGQLPNLAKPNTRLAVVSDDIMSYLLDTATEVVARIKLEDDSKTVQDGALWYEESLPTESVLYSLVLASASRKKGAAHTAEQVMQHVALLTKSLLQLGGKATVGRGLCRFYMAGGDA